MTATKNRGSLASPAERRVLNAARRWRVAYMRWIESESPDRDLAANGENLALSKLLDSLVGLDEERRSHGS